MMQYFYCPKCKETWPYPIEKCPHCFEKIQREEQGKKIKVLSVCKVQIPTFLHEKTPYFVLLLEDEKGHRWVQKSEKEYKVGDEFLLEKAKDKKNSVVLWRIKYDFYQAIEKIFDLLSIDVLADFKILILPTLETPVHPYFKENTSPEFFSALLEFLFQKGVKKENIKVLGQSFNQFDIGACAQKSQLLSVCQKFGVLPFDISQGEFILKENLEIFKEVFDSNLILNLSMLKQSRIQSLENLLKLIKKENYLSQEYLSSKEEIFKKLLEILPPVLTLGQADVVQRKDKKHFILDLLLGSFNVLNLERVFFEISFPNEIPPFLKEIDLKEIEIVGRKISEVQVIAFSL
jgi:uncharacterized OB-fold protein